MNLSDQLLTVLDEYKQLGIAEQIDYDKFYLYSLITHSTAIEGSTVTEIENQLLFDEGISAKGRTMQEQLMNLDLKKAYEQAIRLAKLHTDFSVEMLKELSSIVMKNTGSQYNTVQGSFDASKGDLRLVNVTAGAGGKSYLNYAKVPSKLTTFCQEMNKRRWVLADSKDILEQYLLSFDAHFQLVTIHPWADGNGRMSRLIMNYIQFEFGLVPTKVKKEDKAEYIQALVESREQDNTLPFREFMLREHLTNLRKEIENFKQSEGGQKTEKVDRKGGQKTRDAILDLIKTDETITSTRMAESLGINRSAVSKHLKKLQDEGVIRREGPDKGGKWIIVK
ncbi:MAG: Fic family protein [Bacteroidales bacterium]|nr:Fic family protein [Bacteroidales bacterium]